MNKSFVILFVYLTLCSCYKTERNCKDYKTGMFELKYFQEGIEKRGKFRRTAAYNIDYYDNNIDSSTVRWINDCEFILEKLNPNTENESKAIHMKILTTTDSSYTFEYKYAVKDPYKPLKVFKGEAKRLDRND